jgi:uncharacterized protein (DUF2062 family)
MNVKHWLHQHSLKLLALRDTPNAIAGGVAIGVFFGFIPVVGLKTLCAMFVAWLTRSNILAAVIAGALHDVIFPLMPAVYLWEYDVGYWLLSHPHRWPTLTKLHWEGHSWREWRTYFTVGKPLLLGSVVCSAPFAAISFFITQKIIARHHLKRAEHERAEAIAKANEPDIADEV